MKNNTYAKTIIYKGGGAYEKVKRVFKIQI